MTNVIGGETGLRLNLRPETQSYGLKPLIWKCLICYVTEETVWHLTAPHSSFLEAFSSVLNSVHQGGRKSAGLGVGGGPRGGQGGAVKRPSLLFYGPSPCLFLCYEDWRLGLLLLDLKFLFYWNLHLQLAGLPPVLAHSMWTTRVYKSKLLGEVRGFDVNTVCLLVWKSFRNCWQADYGTRLVKRPGLTRKGSWSSCVLKGERRPSSLLKQGLPKLDDFAEITLNVVALTLKNLDLYINEIYLIYMLQLNTQLWWISLFMAKILMMLRIPSET